MGHNHKRLRHGVLEVLYDTDNEHSCFCNLIRSQNRSIGKRFRRKCAKPLLSYGCSNGTYMFSLYLEMVVQCMPPMPPMLGA